MFLSEWREFPSAPCFAGKKIEEGSRLDVVEMARVAWHVSFSLCEKKRLAIRHMNWPRPTTSEVVRAKDFSAPPRRLTGYKTSAPGTSNEYDENV